jgi:hypothetical protein
LPIQEWIKAKKARTIILFEGRDAAGKGGAIKAITEKVSPRVFRVVSHSPERDPNASHGGGEFDSDLWTVELKYHAFFILQLHTASTGRQRAASADDAVGALNVARTSNIQGAPDEFGGGRPNRGTDAHPGHREGIVMTSESQHAVAAADANDEAAFCKYHANRTGFGVRSGHEGGREHQSRSGDPNNLEHALWHCLLP